MLNPGLFCSILFLGIAFIPNLLAQKLLPGRYNSDIFHKSFHWKPKKEKGFQHYRAELTQASQGLHVEVFLGTWCSDSEKWVPRFMDLEKRLGLQNVTYILVDEDKSDPDGLSQTRQITHVPTFIWKQNGVEVARIVESPSNTYLYLDVLLKLQSIPNTNHSDK